MGKPSGSSVSVAEIAESCPAAAIKVGGRHDVLACAVGTPIELRKGNGLQRYNTTPPGDFEAHVRTIDCGLRIADLSCRSS